MMASDPRGPQGQTLQGSCNLQLCAHGHSTDHEDTAQTLRIFSPHPSTSKFARLAQSPQDPIQQGQHAGSTWEVATTRCLKWATSYLHKT